MLTAHRKSKNYGNFRFIAVRQDDGIKLFFFAYLPTCLPVGRENPPQRGGPMTSQ
jgi:hypothetical protein